jgi:hypothetical protein
MKNKIIAVFIAVTLFAPALVSTVHARDSRGSQGEILFTDALYGAAVGGLIGLGSYAIDDKDLSGKVGAGVVVGAVLGLVYGLYETKSFAEYKDNKVQFAIPTPEVEIKGSETVYKVSLFKAEFK